MRPIDADALPTGRVEWEDIVNAPTVDAEPIILPIGVVKEYDNGMVAMRKETYQEYHAIAVNEAVRRLDVEVLPEIERSTST